MPATFSMSGLGAPSPINPRDPTTILVLRVVLVQGDHLEQKNGKLLRVL